MFYFNGSFLHEILTKETYFLKMTQAFKKIVKIQLPYIFYHYYFERERHVYNPQKF